MSPVAGYGGGAAGRDVGQREARRHARVPVAFPKQREGVAAQVAGGEAVLLDIESGKYYSLNPVGSRIWELCDGTRSTAEIVSVICAEFEVAQEVAMADAREIIRDLNSEKLIVGA